MRLILVRHGETDKNLNSAAKGKNVSLNETGRQQAELVTYQLASEKINIVYSSDLLRAQQTTAVIIKHHPDVRVIYTEELRERSSGQLADLSWAEKEVIQKSSGQGVRDWRPTGGESLRDVKDRAGRWFTKIRLQDADKTVLVVGHGLFMYALLECAIEDGADVEQEDFMLKNCSITILDVHPTGRAQVIHLNDISHFQ